MILFIAIQLIALMLLLWQVRGLVLSMSRNRRLASLIGSAEILNEGSPEGAYVRLEGTITSPEGRTPFGDEPCSWWHSHVKAVFQTKAKKPGKGMTTHKPRVLIDSADAMPLLVEGGSVVAQGLFESLEQVLINPLHASSTAERPPSGQIDVQPKYQSYEIEEYWLPRNAPVVLCGTVVGRNEQVVTVSGDADHDHPPMLYAGTGKELVSRFRRYAGGATLLLVTLVLCSVAYFGAANAFGSVYALNLTFVIGTPLGLLIVTLLMRRWWKV